MRLAASTLILFSENFFGGVITTLVSFHSTRTPMLSRTSIMRCTSSILGMRWRVVTPRLSRLAHSRPTAPFFEVLVSMVPDSFLLPSILILTVPGERVMRFLPKAAPMRFSISALTFCLPDSILATALWVVFNFLAKSAWVIPLVSRMSAIRCPIFCI